MAGLLDRNTVNPDLLKTDMINQTKNMNMNSNMIPSDTVNNVVPQNVNSSDNLAKMNSNNDKRLFVDDSIHKAMSGSGRYSSMLETKINLGFNDMLKDYEANPQKYPTDKKGLSDFFLNFLKSEEKNNGTTISGWAEKMASALADIWGKSVSNNPNVIGG